VFLSQIHEMPAVTIIDKEYYFQSPVDKSSILKLEVHFIEKKCC
jgi:hypothetical protein